MKLALFAAFRRYGFGHSRSSAALSSRRSRGRLRQPLSDFRGQSEMLLAANHFQWRRNPLRGADFGAQPRNSCASGGPLPRVETPALGGFGNGLDGYGNRGVVMAQHRNVSARLERFYHAFGVPVAPRDRAHP